MLERTEVRDGGMDSLIQRLRANGQEGRGYVCSLPAFSSSMCGKCIALRLVSHVLSTGHLHYLV